jgi:hypothetical protein
MNNETEAQQTQVKYDWPKLTGMIVAVLFVTLSSQGALVLADKETISNIDIAKLILGILSPVGAQIWAFFTNSQITIKGK